MKQVFGWETSTLRRHAILCSMFIGKPNSSHSTPCKLWVRLLAFPCGFVEAHAVCNCSERFDRKHLGCFQPVSRIISLQASCVCQCTISWSTRLTPSAASHACREASSDSLLSLRPSLAAELAAVAPPYSIQGRCLTSLHLPVRVATQLTQSEISAPVNLSLTVPLNASDCTSSSQRLTGALIRTSSTILTEE